ncbi:MAG: ABC transporter permease [Deltaproteobacteria bacterium]|nr:MAG: ABC transporter permease [Deltaproteobacteria bacterium]
MWLFTLALRNLFRHRSRTLLTGLAIAASFALVALHMHFEYGSWNQRIRGSVEAVSGHLVVQHPDRADDPQVEYVVSRSAEVSGALQRTFPEARVLRRAQVGGLLASPRNTSPLFVSGIEPDREAQVTRIDDLFQDADAARAALDSAPEPTREALQREAERGLGSWLEPQDLRGIVIGAPVARTLEVELGDRVVLMAQVGDELQSIPLVVRGIYSTGIDRADAVVAYTTLQAVQPLLVDPKTGEPVPDPAHQVAVHFEHERGLDALAARAAQAVDRSDLSTLTWRQAMPTLLRQMEVDRSFGIILHVFIGLIVVVVIFTTLLMSALERTREIGLLMALGMRPKHIRAMFWAEAALLGLGGTVAGFVLHLPFYAFLAYVGIDLGDMIAGSSDIAGVVFDPVMRAEFDPDALFYYGPFTFLLTLLASIGPAYKASRLTPVDAMRHT